MAKARTNARTEGRGLVNSATNWVLEATIQIPEMVYVIGVVGLSAAASLCLGFFFAQWLFAIFGFIATFVGMLLVRLYAKWTPRRKDIHGAMTVLVWASVLSFVLLLAIGVTAVAKELFWPKPSFTATILLHDQDTPLELLEASGTITLILDGTPKPFPVNDIGTIQIPDLAHDLTGNAIDWKINIPGYIKPANAGRIRLQPGNINVYVARAPKPFSIVIQLHENDKTELLDADGTLTLILDGTPAKYKFERPAVVKVSDLSPDLIGKEIDWDVDVPLFHRPASAKKILLTPGAEIHLELEPESPLSIEFPDKSLEPPIEQPVVNYKYDKDRKRIAGSNIEHSRFRVSIDNSSSQTIHVDEASFVPTAISVVTYPYVKWDWNSSNKDADMIVANLGVPEVGDASVFGGVKDLAPTQENFTIYFQADVDPKGRPGIDVMTIEGRIVLKHDRLEVQSEKIILTIHEDSRELHYPTSQPEKNTPPVISFKDIDAQWKEARNRLLANPADKKGKDAISSLHEDYAKRRYIVSWDCYVQEASPTGEYYTITPREQRDDRLQDEVQPSQHQAYFTASVDFRTNLPEGTHKIIEGVLDEVNERGIVLKRCRFVK